MSCREDLPLTQALKMLTLRTVNTQSYGGAALNVLFIRGRNISPNLTMLRGYDLPATCADIFLLTPRILPRVGVLSIQSDREIWLLDVAATSPASTLIGWTDKVLPPEPIEVNSLHVALKIQRTFGHVSIG